MNFVTLEVMSASGKDRELMEVVKSPLQRWPPSAQTWYNPALQSVGPGIWLSLLSSGCSSIDIEFITREISQRGLWQSE